MMVYLMVDDGITVLMSFLQALQLLLSLVVEQNKAGLIN